jgi:hypothetical protein
METTAEKSGVQADLKSLPMPEVQNLHREQSWNYQCHRPGAVIIDHCGATLGNRLDA